MRGDDPRFLTEPCFRAGLFYWMDDARIPRAAFVPLLADILTIIGFIRANAVRAIRLSWTSERTKSRRVKRYPDGVEIIEKRTAKRRLDLG